MDTPLVSVIVPIYNVEKYLTKCLDTITHQTYRNLEIILVDDGSEDGCKEICDHYKNLDSRIKLIHKKNGGLASARNAGLKLATGKYIGWVDSDDWIELDMFEYLVSNAEQYSADIAICGRIEHYNGRERNITCENVKSLTSEQAIEELLKSKVIANYMWDKLWRKELFEDIQFPNGQVYEDVAVAHILFIRANGIICLPDEKYHYQYRDGSIINDYSLKKRLTYFRVLLKRSEELDTNNIYHNSLLKAQCVIAAIRIWCCYSKNPKKERDKYHSEVVKISRFCKEFSCQAQKYIELGIAGNLIIHLLPHTNLPAFIVAHFIDDLYFLKHGQRL